MLKHARCGKKTPPANSGNAGELSRQAAAAPDVSRRGTLWTHQRLPLLLVQKATAPLGEGHAQSSIRLCLCGSQPAGWPTRFTGAPEVNGQWMHVFFTEVASRYPDENIVMVLDGAGWHKNTRFELPVNLKLLFLPPYSPELNPQEHVWDELREKCFHNKTFDSLNLLEDHLVSSLNVLETQYETIQNIVAWDWIMSACSIGN
jgi:transposase